MFELSGFDVTRSNNYFKLCDSPVAIHLNEFTKMVEVPAVAHLISTEIFQVCLHLYFVAMNLIFVFTHLIPFNPSSAPHGGGHTPDDDMHSKFNVGVSSGGNPAEGGEDPMEPSDAEETIASHEHT
uniref:Uncharacterized protein n=1 Tax=Brassica campestris TaxID=3711 RepID=A0A3P5ZVE2_BRACM|nr:unnamed protein product [Brassica rapa]